MTQEIIPSTEPDLTFDAVVDHVLAQIACGRSISRILREDPDMPPAHVFWKRHYADEELQKKVARAREHGVEAVLEDARDIADTPMEGVERTVERGPDGTKTRETRKEMLGHRRLQIDTRIKYAQMIAPRKYGAKLDLTSDGEKLSSVADAIAAGNKRLEQKNGG